MTAVRLDHAPLEGRHYETGTLHNALAVLGATAPHTGQPYSEALLLGISGGIAFGYFTFAYKGWLPHVALLTRNTFDPFETMLERLAVPREVRQTANPATAERQLREALETGEAPVVWADTFSLPYYGLSPNTQIWWMRPLVVVGQTAGGDSFWVADSARRPWRVSAADLSRARERVKQDRYRLMTVEPPNPDRLASAVRAGLQQCRRLFTEAPPKGARDNFGFAAYDKWAAMLVNQRSKHGWARLFPPGLALYQALGGSLAQPGIYSWVMTWGSAEDADRRLFADCLDEAATILNQPRLRGAGHQFRLAADAWHSVALAALPEHVPLLHETRRLLSRRRILFSEGSEAALEERAAIRKRLDEIWKEVEREFPLSAAEVMALLEQLSEGVQQIRQREQAAVNELRSDP